MVKKISRLGFFKELKKKRYHLLVAEEMVYESLFVKFIPTYVRTRPFQ